MPLTTRIHGAREILFADYRNLDGPACLVLLREIVEAVLATPVGVPILLMSNLEGATVNAEFMGQVKHYGKTLNHRLTREAIVGATGIKQVLLNGYLRFTGSKKTKAFATEAEALAFLIGP